MKEQTSDKQFITGLQTGSKPDIIELLKQFRSSGNDFTLPYVISLLKQHLDEDIENEVLSILNDLKNQPSAEILVKEMKSLSESSRFKEIVASCWQNGLDYSRHCRYFAELVIQEEYELSFEAFTVLESNVMQLEHEERTKLMEYLKSNSENIEESKKALFQKMLSLVAESFTGPLFYQN